MAMHCIGHAKECTGCCACLQRYEPEPKYVCAHCGETIYEEDRYYELFGERFCMECVMVRKA